MNVGGTTEEETVERFEGVSRTLGPHRFLRLDFGASVETIEGVMLSWGVSRELLLDAVLEEEG